MDKYYYLISQLPVLYFDKESYMTTDYFLEEAEKWMSAGDYFLLSEIEINDVSLSKKSPRLWQNYQAFEYGLRSDLVLWRKARKAGQEHKPASFPTSIVKEGNPLEVEKKLLKLRWDFLDEMESEHHFDLDFLVSYFLKLQILRRLSLFDKEKGLEKFQKICRVTV